MKKGNKNIFFLSLSVISLFLPNLIFSDENILKEQINKQEQDEKIRNLQNEKSLEHLFDNAKFPVDDYIYKAGKKEPNNNEQNIGEILKKIEELDLKREETPLNKQTTTPKELMAEQEEIRQRVIAKQDELKAKQENLKQDIITDNQTAYENKMRKLIRAQILANRNNEIKDATINSSKYGVDGFSNQKSVDISTNEHRLYRSIRAGRMIPAILTTAISSDLNGVVTAQIEQDIYASMGRAVLIPRGSKAIGFYTNDTKIGHERLEIKWREIITPQGINIMLTNAIVADNMGMNGAVGAINNKYWERYGIASSISTVTNAMLLGIASKINNGNNTNNQYVNEIYSNARSDVSSVVQDIIQQQSQIKPTIEIKSGSRIFLVPTNHMWFAKPKNGEVMMKYFND